MSTSYIEQLKRCYLFSSVPEFEIALFVENSRAVKHENDATIYDVGDTPESVYVVLSGSVKIEVPLPDGEILFIGVMPNNTLFGEHEALCNANSVARISTVSDTEILVVPKGNFLRLFENVPCFSQSLARQSAMSMRMLCLAAAHHFNSSAEKRLASLLMHLSDRIGSQQENVVRLGLKYSQDELAHMVSSTRQTVNKYLKEWKTNEWIGINQGYIEIYNREPLEKLSSEKLLKEIGVLNQ